MFHFKQKDPNPILRDYIKGYWLMEKQYSEEEVPLFLIPDGYPELMFHYGEHFQLNKNGRVENLAASNLLGQITSTFEMKAEVGSRAFFVKMYPWVPSLIFDIPQDRILNKSVDLEVIAKSPKIKVLRKLLCSSASFEESILLIERFFIHEIRLQEKKHPILSFAIRQILKSKGRIGMDELGRQIKFSNRYIEQLFKKDLGISPKRFARLIRAKDVSCGLLEHSDTSLSAIAQEYGYFDQSHFIKDFKSISQQTPGQYLAYMKKFPIHEVEDYLLQFR